MRMLFNSEYRRRTLAERLLSVCVHRRIVGGLGICALGRDVPFEPSKV